jgi:beta-barrel assembly-enhancing protease
MPSTSAPFDARLFDGSSARAQPVSITLDGGVLAIAKDGGVETIPLADIRREKRPHDIALHRTDQPDWRLIPEASAINAFADIPSLHAVTTRHWKWIGGSAATVGSVAALIWFFGATLLVWAAPYVPHRVTAQMGAQYAALFMAQGGECNNAQGRAALDKLVNRIKPRQGFVEPVRVRVANNPMVNAITLPGGEVIVFSELIDKAESPDELAGVLAHEFGHVQHRHANQALIRQFGLGVFMQGVGGDIGNLAATTVMLSNGRKAEADADGDAITLLRDARVSPIGLAQFFDRLSAGKGETDAKGQAVRSDSSLDKIASMLDTHPGSADRRKRFAEAARGVNATPILDGVEWQALHNICAK